MQHTRQQELYVQISYYFIMTNIRHMIHSADVSVC
jgi:hypothetical protein